MSITDWTAAWGAILSTALAVSNLWQGRPRVSVKPHATEYEDRSKKFEIVAFNISGVTIFLERIWLSDRDLRVRSDYLKIIEDIDGTQNEINGYVCDFIPPHSCRTYLIFRDDERALKPTQRIYGCIWWYRSNGGLCPTLPILFQLGSRRRRHIAHSVN